METNRNQKKTLIIVVTAVGALLIIGAIVALLMIRGAGNKTYISPNGIEISADGKFAFISDETGKAVYRITLPNGRKSKTYQAKRQVNGVAEGDGVLYVLEGGLDGTVVCLDNDMSEKGTVDVGHTPSDMVIADGVGYVTNRFSNSVSVIDLNKMEKITDIDLAGRQPLNGVLANGKVYISCLLPDEAMSDKGASAKVCVIDTATNTVSKVVSIVNGAGGMRGICASPDGTAVYVSHIVARYTYPTTQLDAGWVNTNAITWIDTASDNVVTSALLDEVNEGAANPWGIAVSEDGKTLYVALAGAQEMMTVDLEGFAERVDAVRQGKGVVDSVDAIVNYLPFLDGIRQRYSLEGKGPRALAVQGNTAYICQYFSGDLAVIDTSARDRQIRTVSLGKQPEASDARYGQLLWFDASFCYQKWQSCSSCHPDGRPDGFSWDESSDGMGNVKSTKSLLYSHRTPPVLATGLEETAEVAVRGGMKTTHYHLLDEVGMCAIDAYLKSLVPERSPYLNRDGILTESAARGKELFESAGCAQCHPAPLYTDMKFHEVNTETPGSWEKVPYDTPTLVEVWRTAPYLHDGRVKTIEEVVRMFAPKLTDDEVNDLANYVKSIGNEQETYGVEQVIASTSDGRETYINKLVPGSAVQQISIRMQVDSAPAAKAVVELLSADGNSIFKKEYQLNGIAYNQDYAIKLKSPIEIPKNLGKGACLRISIEKNDGGKLATDFEIKN